MNLVGLNGLKGSGKDTVGEYLVERYDYERLSFAGLLKASAAALFDIEPDAWDELKNQEDAIISFTSGLREGGSYSTSLTAREFLQRYGTEAHRDIFGEDFWVDALFNSIPLPEVKTIRGHRRILAARKYVITDVRFANELKAILHSGGINVQILRPGLESDGHRSEAAPDESLITVQIDNVGTIEELYDAVDVWVEMIQYDGSAATVRFS